MYLPDYNTIKFEQQERIDKAAAQHDANHVHRMAKLARRAERIDQAEQRRVHRRARQSARTRLVAVLRRLRLAPS